GGGGGPGGEGLGGAVGSGPALEAGVASRGVGAAGGAEMAAAREAAADVPPARIDASASGGELATVQGVEFDNQGGRDRITVVADRPVDYVVHEPDADTVVLSVAKARLQPRLDPRIAPAPGGPVSLVTAFEQPEMKVPEVRVVVERAAHLEPQVRREGSLVVIEFPHAGGVAATPPVLDHPPAGAAETAKADAGHEGGPAAIAP